MKILILYFSATGNTRTLAQVIGASLRELGAEVALSDITPQAARQARIDLEAFEAVVFGAPIHSWRAPRVVRDWMGSLDGHGMKCSMFFSYGGFGVHPTHYSTRQILQRQGFSIVSSAEFLGAHTFNLGGWKAMEGRPDETDFEVAREYARVTYRRFTGEDRGVLGKLEKTHYSDRELDSIESFRFNVLTQLPTRGAQSCSMCLVCEEVCPTGALKAEAGTADGDRCIACLACVAHCPDKALKINDMSNSWSFKLEMEKTSPEELRRQRSRLYL